MAHKKGQGRFITVVNRKQTTWSKGFGGQFRPEILLYVNAEKNTIRVQTLEG